MLNRRFGVWVYAALIALAGALAGCTSTPMMRAEVTRFHRFETQPPRTFAMGTATAQASSLEYRSYADLLRQQLIAQGFTEASAESARYRVEFETQVTADLNRSWAMGPAYGAYGWPYGPWPGPGRPLPYRWSAYPGGWGMPTVAVPMDVTVWVHTVRMTIIEALPVAGAPARTVFESNAVARAFEPSLPRLMPGLVDAVLRGFPGVDGTAQLIEVPLPAAPAQGAKPVAR